MSANNERRRILRKGLISLGLEHCGEQTDKLMAFIEDVEYWNPQYKLIAAGEDLLTRHILDSLAGLALIKSFNPGSIADIGSGAGFPGIPLSLWLPDTEFRLIERSRRRAGFLRNMAISHALANVQIVEKPVEEAIAEGPFDIITFRAWSTINKKNLAVLFSLLKPDGVIAAYKGRKANIKEELQAVSYLLDTEINPLTVPGLDAERCLCIIKKP